MEFPNTHVTIMQLNYGVRGIGKRKMMGFVMDDRKMERKVVVLSQNSHFLIYAVLHSYGIFMFNFF